MLLVWFTTGLAVIMRPHLSAWLIISYLLIWIWFYVGTMIGWCRKCQYFGRGWYFAGTSAPLMMKKCSGRYNYVDLFYAGGALLLNLFFPIVVTIWFHQWALTLVYTFMLVVFVFLHLRYTSCYMCSEESCPINPNFKSHPDDIALLKCAGRLSPKFWSFLHFAKVPPLAKGRVGGVEKNR